MIKESVLKLPKSVETRIEDLYDYIFDNYESIIQVFVKDIDFYQENAYIDPKLKNYFRLKEVGGKFKYISVALLFNNKVEWDFAYNLNNKSIFVNVAYFSNYESFLYGMEHELTHAVDPAVSLDPTQGAANSKKEFNYYIQHETEINAFSTSIIRQILRRLNKNKNEDINSLYLLLSDIKSNSLTDIIENAKYENILNIIGNNYNNLYNILHILKIWSENSKIYNKFIKVLYQSLNKQK